MIKGLGVFLLLLYGVFSMKLESFMPGLSYFILCFLSLASGSAAVYCLLVPEDFSTALWAPLQTPFPLRTGALIRELEALAGGVRQEGLLSLESRRKEIPDPFLRHLLKKIMDGHEKAVLLPLIRSQSILRIELIDRVEDLFNRFLDSLPLLGLLPTLFVLVVRVGANEGGGVGPALIPFTASLFLQLVLQSAFGGRFEEWRASTRLHYGLLEEGVTAIQDGISIEVLRDRLTSRAQLGPRWADA